MHLEQITVQTTGEFDLAAIRMIKIKQHFPDKALEDVEAVVNREMEKVLSATVVKNRRIAITAGSRGIKDGARIIRLMVSKLREWGGEPFIVPAMGSHGGATAEGQKALLEEFGISEKSVGAPIRSSMEVVQIAALGDGTPVYCDKLAMESDGIVVLNKIKPHADFKGDYESGLLKMMAVGLGKHKGATALHLHGFDQFHRLLPEAGRIILQKAPILFGMAILENAYKKLLRIEIIPKEAILEREKQLLHEAKRNMPKLLLPEIDLLIVDEIGKNISGEGMDPNVTGRPGSGLSGFEAPPIQKIIVREITKESHGNGVGIGMADISTLKCISQIDFNMMYTNAITATILGPAKLPLIMNNDREAVLIALKTCNRISAETAKIVRIKNTAELSEIKVSEAYRDYIAEHAELAVLSDPQPLEFTADGCLK